MNCQKTPGPRPRETLTLARDRKLTLQTQTWAPLARWQERVLHWSCQFNQLCQRSPTRKLFCRHSYPLTIYGSHHLYMLLVWCFEAFLATWPLVSTSHVICLQLELSTLRWLYCNTNITQLWREVRWTTGWVFPQASTCLCPSVSVLQHILYVAASSQNTWSNLIWTKITYSATLLCL